MQTEKQARWQVVVGDRLPPVEPLHFEADSEKQSRSPERASMRGPTFWLMIISTIELAAVYGTQNPSAVATAQYRVMLVAITFMTGLIAGKRRGFAAIIILLSTAVLSLLQGLSLAQTGLALLQSPELLGQFTPTIMSQGLAMMAALRTGWMVRK